MPVGLQVDLDLDDARVAAAARPAMRQFIRSLAEQTLPVAGSFIARPQFRTVAPAPGQNTGRLRATGRVVVDDADVNPVALVVFGGPDAPYAEHHHQGTRPHTITVRRARALRFFTAAGGPVFALSVRHPGTRANPFLTDAINEVLRRRGDISDPGTVVRSTHTSR